MKNLIFLRTMVILNFDKEDILANHKSFMSLLNIPINVENCELSTLYWIPKFQKNQVYSSTCSTQELHCMYTYD